jgi:hypothetical protein
MVELKPDVSPHRNKALSTLRSFWRSAVPTRVLWLYIVCNLTFSFLYFCREARRLVILHVIVVAGALLFILLLTGLLFAVSITGLVVLLDTARPSSSPAGSAHWPFCI